MTGAKRLRGPRDQARTPRQRRVHRKSRQGCQRCKIRHVKCDEKRPACSSCEISGFECAYTKIAATSATPNVLTPSPSETIHIDTSGKSHRDISEQILHCSTSAQIREASVPHRSPNVTPQSSSLNLAHLELLHHFLSHTIHDLDYGEGERSIAASNDMIGRALAHPPLMLEVLAFASYHLSKLKPDRQEQYITQATMLQTEAITLFNARSINVEGDSHGSTRSPGEQSREGGPDHRIAAILFSSILGIHVLSETISCPSVSTSFSDYLDRFVNYLRVHRGVHDLAKGSWQDLQASSLGLYISTDSALEEHAITSPGSECQYLETLLENADLSATSISICQRQIQALKQIFNTSRTGNTYQPKLTTLITFLILLSPEFLRLIELRKGEALAILAHFAILVHCRRDHWVFQDGGRYMIESIVAYLGPGWEQWLKLPLAILDVG